MKNKIIERINRNANRYLPMDEFIEMALYDPEKGYYTKFNPKIGRNGDFYTSSSISSVFGEVIAKWINKRIYDEGHPPIVCELGAGTGQLALSIIESIKGLDSLVKDFQYIIVEGSPFHRKLIEEKTKDYDFVKIISSFDQLESFEGIILSNEFFDAFPVKVAMYQNGTWVEIGVTEENGQLIETKRQASFDITQFIAGIELSNPFENQRIEVPFANLNAYKSICGKLKKGTILSIDYGMINDDLQYLERVKGSLRGFYKHQLIDCILDKTGEIDITSNVLFEELAKQGEKAGFETVSLKKQKEFLIENGILELLIEHQDPDPFSKKSRRNRSIIQFINDGDISSYFYVLEQSKRLK